MGLRRRTMLAVLATTPIVALGRSVGATTTEAENFIRLIGDQVMAVLQNPSKNDEAKLAALKELLDNHTDLDLVARLVLGRHWRDASTEQRSEFVALFRQILMNTMAERISDYNGQTFEVSGSSRRSERDTAVQSRIIRTSGAPPLRVDWRLRESDGQFAIIDLEVEGVSLVVSQRAEVSSVVERSGMSGLIQTMRERSGEGSTVL